MPIDDTRLVCTKNIFKHRTQHNKQAIFISTPVIIADRQEREKRTVDDVKIGKPLILTRPNIIIIIVAQRGRKRQLYFVISDSAVRISSKNIFFLNHTTSLNGSCTINRHASPI